MRVAGGRDGLRTGRLDKVRPVRSRRSSRAPEGRTHGNGSAEADGRRTRTRPGTCEGIDHACQGSRAAKAPAATPKYLAGVQLISRDILFGNPEKAAARLSHDGKQLAFLAPVNDVLNVWVGPADNPSAAKPVTKDTLRGIRTYFWAYTNNHILYLQDTGGDENWHIYRVDLATNETKDLTPIEKVNAQIEEVSHKFPTEIMVGLNNRDPQMHDIYRLNIETGEKQLVQENKEGFTGFLTDEDYKVRFASRYSPDGGRELLEPDGKGGWKDFMRIKMEDDMTTSAIGFDKTGNKLYLIDSRGRNTGALAQLDLQDDKEKFIAENEKADIGGVLMHPTEKTIDAVSFNYTETEWQIINPEYRADFDYLKNVEDGEIDITSQTLDNQRLDRSIRQGRRADKKLSLRPWAKSQSHLPVQQSQRTGRAAAREDAPAGDQGPRWAGTGQLFELAAGNRQRSRRPTEPAGADGARRSRRALGSRRLGLQPRCTSGSPIAAMPC